MALPRLSPGIGAPSAIKDDPDEPPPTRGPGGELSPGPGGGDGAGDDEIEDDDRPDDDDDDREVERTIEQLRKTGDPNKVDRTPVLESGDIDVATNEWPLGFPLQGIPRIAAVVNLNYIYNESTGEWERDTGNSPSGITQAAYAYQTSNVGQTLGTIGPQQIVFDDTEYDSDGLVDLQNDEIVIQDDGLHLVNASITVDNAGNTDSLRLRVAEGFNRFLQARIDILDETAATANASAVLDLAEGDKLGLVANVGNSSCTVDDGEDETFLNVVRFNDLLG